MILRMLVVILLGHAQVALSEPTEPRLKILESSFDGRTLTALMLVCATSAAVHIDADSMPGTFRVTEATACGSNERVEGLRASDYSGANTRTLKVPPKTCSGREISVRVASDDAPIRGCVDLGVTGLLFTITGRWNGLVRSIIRVSAKTP